MGDFKTDLQRGQDAERTVIQLLEKNSIVCNTPDVERKDLKYFDIVAFLLPDQHQFTLEVKRDFKEAETGNLAMEVKNTDFNEYSGLFVTMSDIWVEVLDSGIYIAQRQRLFDYINTHKPKHIVKNAGDGNAHIYLYRSKKILSDVFYRIDDMPQNKIYRLLRRLLNAQITSLD